jgi:membrane-anchored mycosin MYCP
MRAGRAGIAGRVGRVAAVLALGAGLAGAAGAAPAFGAGPAAAVPAAAFARSADSGQCSDGTGAHVTQAPPALAQLQSELAWATTQGQGALVAVVDSGVDASNPHLAGAIAGGVDLVGDGKGNGGLADLDGHGTAVAGQIAARPIDGSGVIGLAPQARIYSVRVFAASDDQARKDGTGPTVPRIAQGIRVAADAHAQVINVSLSTSADDPQLRDAVAYATAHGSLVVASSGNVDSSDSVEKTPAVGARFPAGDPGVLGTSAVTTTGAESDDSVHGSHVSIAAPGQNIVTAARAGIDCVYAADTPATSFATAYVSASAALVASAHPGESPAQWAYRLEATAVRPDPDARDDQTGWGVVQPYDAIVLVPGLGVPGPASPFGASSGTPAGSTGTVTLAHRTPATALATTIAVLGAVGAAVVLGTVAVIGVLLKRRRDAASDLEPLDDGRPLMGRAGTPGG